MFKKLPQLMFYLIISKGESAKTSFIKSFVIWVFEVTIKGVIMSFIIILFGTSVTLLVHSYWLKDIMSIVLFFVCFPLESFSQDVWTICQCLCKKAVGE